MSNERGVIFSEEKDLELNITVKDVGRKMHILRLTMKSDLKAQMAKTLKHSNNLKVIQVHGSLEGQNRKFLEKWHTV